MEFGVRVSNEEGGETSHTLAVVRKKDLSMYLNSSLGLIPFLPTLFRSHASGLRANVGQWRQQRASWAVAAFVAALLLAATCARPAAAATDTAEATAFQAVANALAPGWQATFTTAYTTAPACKNN